MSFSHPFPERDRFETRCNSNLYSTFITPWSDSKTASALHIEPEFHLPSCYNVQPPPAGSKIGNFSDETLFFIFYSQPRDAMQEMAAHELFVLVFLLPPSSRPDVWNGHLDISTTGDTTRS